MGTAPACLPACATGETEAWRWGGHLPCFGGNVEVLRDLLWVWEAVPGNRAHAAAHRHQMWVFLLGGVVNLYSIQAGREADVIDPVDTRAEQAFHFPGVILKCGFYVGFFCNWLYCSQKGKACISEYAGESFLVGFKQKIKCFNCYKRILLEWHRQDGDCRCWHSRNERRIKSKPESCPKTQSQTAASKP